MRCVGRDLIATTVSIEAGSANVLSLPYPSTCAVCLHSHIKTYIEGADFNLDTTRHIIQHIE